MKKFMLKTAVLIAAVAFLVFAGLILTGPRMRTQVNIKAFQARMPGTPKGVVPVVDAFQPLPDKLMRNPVEANAVNIARGKVYYGYYCVFCHGEKGAGDGPVGYSYVPVPADLRTEKVQKMAGGELVGAMLTGTGHEPVLSRVVEPNHRWYIELYVRNLGSKNP